VAEEVYVINYSSRSDDAGGAEERFAEKPAGVKKKNVLKLEDLMFG